MDRERKTACALHINGLNAALLNALTQAWHMLTFDRASLLSHQAEVAPHRPEWETVAPSFCPADAPKDTRRRLSPPSEFPPIFAVLLLIALKQRHSCRLVPGNWLHIEAVAVRVRFTRGPRAVRRRRHGRNQSSFRRVR